MKVPRALENAPAELSVGTTGSVTVQHSQRLIVFDTDSRSRERKRNRMRKRWLVYYPKPSYSDRLYGVLPVGQ